MYKMVIFDLDGTLLDTIGDLSAAGNFALENMGLSTHSADAYKYFVGNGIPKLIERMLPKEHTAQDESRALELFSEYYGVHKTDNTRPYDGMTELVEELDEKGVVCVCNSNKAHEFSNALVKSYYGDHIRAVMGAGLGFLPKPDPGAALELCRRFDIDTKDTVYAGDSDVDILTAHAANIDCCAVLWGFRKKEELLRCSPEFAAETPDELKQIIVNDK